MVDGFREMVQRLGVSRAAGRLGVSVGTIRRWLSAGVPAGRAREVEEAVWRHRRALKAAAVSRTYRDLGWERFKNFEEVDEFIGADAGHSRERWVHRKQWWDEHRPGERLPKKIALVRDRFGRLMYVNGDAVVWRGYTVDGRLFWTVAQNLEGYDTPEQMKEIYEALLGRKVVLTW